MYLEKRPTCVTVIGWFWIIVGILLCFGAVMGLYSIGMIGILSAAEAEAEQDMPFFLKMFPALVIVQLGVGVLGIVAGINFLKLKSWARNVLEVLTWLFFFLIIAFVVFWTWNWVSTVSGHRAYESTLFGAMMGIAFLAIYGVPFGIVVKYLRGEKVKGAMARGAEPADPSQQGSAEFPPSS